MSKRLMQKLAKLGLSADENSTPKASAAIKPKQKSVTFRVFFPMPPFHGTTFRALKAGHGAYNFTGLLLGVGGKQLQRIKQESNSKVEVVNGQGNLNGQHPDPLDEGLHALVTADNMAKLEKAVELVVQVLSPINGSFQPFQVEAGGSTRLVVAQASKGKACAHKPKQSKPLHHQSSSSSSNRPKSLDGSSSSCSSKGLPPSPALTPVTPAAMGSRHGSMFAPGSSGPNSCSSSRAHTPSPSMHGSSSRGAGHGQHSSSSTPVCSAESGSKDTHSHLELFQLPPAALPQVPLAAEEWPALPSSQEANSSGSSSSKRVGDGASRPGLFVSGGQDDGEQAGCSNTHQASSQGRSSSGSDGCSTCTACHAEHTNAGGSAAAGGVQTRPQLAASKAAPAQADSIPTGGEQHPFTAVVGSDTAAAEHAMLSPLTPQAQQHQQGPYRQSAGVGPGSPQGGPCAGCGDALGGSCVSMGACCNLAAELPLGQVPFCPKPCDLDLLLLRQRAGLVSQVCLHCDGGGELPASSSVCACAGVPPAPVALQDPYAGAGCMSGLLMGISTGYPAAAVSAAGGGAAVACDPYSLSAGSAWASGADFRGQQGHSEELLRREYQRQAQERSMQMVPAAASVYCGGSGSVGMHSSFPGGSWHITEAQYAANVQVAAVAAAASSAFPSSLPGGGGGAQGLSWDGAASSLGALTSSGFMSIW